MFSFHLGWTQNHHQQILWTMSFQAKQFSYGQVLINKVGICYLILDALYLLLTTWYLMLDTLYLLLYYLLLDTWCFIFATYYLTLFDMPLSLFWRVKMNEKGWETSHENDWGKCPSCTRQLCKNATQDQYRFTFIVCHQIFSGEWPQNITEANWNWQLFKKQPAFKHYFKAY